jgi:hypothetical protein
MIASNISKFNVVTIIIQFNVVSIYAPGIITIGILEN